ncbi:hypothetical protein Prudu_67S000100, partial [Prunus dulcis]
SKRRPGHHRPSRSPPWVPTGPPPCRHHNLTDLNPGAALSWLENHVFRRRFLRSHPNFQLEILLRSPPNRSSKASEVQSTCRRNLRRVKLARTICHRNTRDPPPGHSKLPPHHVRGDSAEISAEV